MAHQIQLNDFDFELLQTSVAVHKKLAKEQPTLYADISKLQKKLHKQRNILTQRKRK